MSLINFINSNLGDNPLINAITIGIMFVAFIEFYHILASIIFSMFKK